MEMLQDITTLSDEDLFMEWKEWFTIYRNMGTLPEKERQYFKDLSQAMRDRKLVTDKIAPSSSWYEDTGY